MFQDPPRRRRVSRRNATIIQPIEANLTPRNTLLIQDINIVNGIVELCAYLPTSRPLLMDGEKVGPDNA